MNGEGSSMVAAWGQSNAAHGNVGGPPMLNKYIPLYLNIAEGVGQASGARKLNSWQGRSG